MAFKMDIVTLDIPGGTGNQTFTGSLGGATPDACMVIVNRASAEGAYTDSVSYAVGFSDDTNERSVGTHTEDAQPTMDTGRISRNTISAMASEYGVSATTAEGICAFTADTVTINWSKVTTGRVTVIMFSGATNAIVGDVLMATTAGATFTVNPGAWVPNCCIALSNGLTATQGTNNAHHSQGFACYNGTSIKQAAQASVSQNNVGNANAGGIMSNDRIAIGTDNLGNTADYGIKLTDFDDAGGEVEFTVLDGDTDGTEHLIYLLLEIPDDGVDIIESPAKTSTGIQNHGSFNFTGFRPEGVIGLLSNRTSYSNTSLNRNDGNWAGQNICAFTDSKVVNHVFAEEDLVGTSNNAQRQGTEVVFIPDDQRNLDVDADFDSMADASFNLNYNATTNAVKISWLGFKGDAVDAAAPNLHGNLKAELVGGF